MSTLNNNFFQSMLMIMVGAAIAVVSPHFGNNQDIAAAGIGLMMVGMRHMEPTNNNKDSVIPVVPVLPAQVPIAEQHDQIDSAQKAHHAAE